VKIRPEIRPNLGKAIAEALAQSSVFNVRHDPSR